MKSTTTSVICLLFLVPSLRSAAQNLLVNPGGEAGEPSTIGWTTVATGSACYTGSGWRVAGIQNGFPGAQEGTYLFYPGCGGTGLGEDYEVMQDINTAASATTIDANAFQVTFSGYMQSYSQVPTDQTTMIVEYRDVTNVIVLDSYNTGVAGNTSGWVNYTDMRTAPAGTRYIRVRLIGTSRNGTSIDSYFDNISITTSPLLSVHFVSFTAALINGAVALNWKTSDEQNNKGFTIQVSRNGTAWSAIGFVPVKAGTGAVKNYAFADKNVITGTSFYRLQQVDIDNRNTYSVVRSVTSKNLQEPIIYPNPSSSTVFIKSLIACSIELTDMAGKVIEKYESTVSSFDISKLKKGIYLLKLTSGQGTIIKRIEKN